MAAKAPKKRVTAKKAARPRRARPKPVDNSDVLELLNEMDALLKKSIGLRAKTRESIERARRAAG